MQIIQCVALLGMEKEFLELREIFKTRALEAAFLLLCTDSL